MLKNVGKSLLAQAFALLTFSIVFGVLVVLRNPEHGGFVNYLRAVGFTAAIYGSIGMPMILLSTVYHSIMFKE